MNDALAQTLSRVGKPTELYPCPDGSELLALPYGGRILGLFAPGSDENFLWTHADLAAETSAREFYASDAWHNSGGDRTWLAPEIDFFFPDFPNTDVYHQPRQLDPGQYDVTRTAWDLRLTNRLTATLSRDKQTVGLLIAKTVSAAPDPLRYESGSSDREGLEYAGYTLRTSLDVQGVGADPPARVGLWNLLQMPHGGDLLVPTYGRTAPKVYFGAIDDEDLIVEDNLVRYRMRATGEHKIGLRAAATTGRVGYAYPARDGRWSLVVRNFLVDPSGEYVDVPWKDTEDLGYAVQACNVNSALGSFSELEYHVPAVGGETHRSHCEDVTQVWAYRGSQDAVRDVAWRLLGRDA